MGASTCEIASQRELVEAFDRTVLDDWDKADPLVHIYFGPKPNERHFRSEVERGKRMLEDLKKAFDRWLGVSS